MKKYLEIRDKSVLVNIEGEMVETKDPELIGLAVLDYISKSEEKDYPYYKEKLLKHLKENNLRKTQERFVILEEMFKVKHPFKTIDVFESMIKKNDISQATIYNNLKLFLESGIIKRSGQSQNKELFKTTYFELQYF